MTDDNGARGVENHKCTVLHLVYDHETCAVSLDVQDAPCALLQMMVHEAAVQLDIMRRQAATIEMLSQRAQTAATAELMNRIRGGRGVMGGRFRSLRSSTSFAL